MNAEQIREHERLTDEDLCGIAHRNRLLVAAPAHLTQPILERLSVVRGRTAVLLASCKCDECKWRRAGSQQLPDYGLN